MELRLKPKDPRDPMITLISKVNASYQQLTLAIHEILETIGRKLMALVDNSIVDTLHFRKQHEQGNLI